MASTNGVPISPDKRAEQLTSSDVGAAFLVLVMEHEQRLFIQQRYPKVSGKVFLLGKWKNLEIDDPINEPPAMFERVWLEIKNSVDDWVGQLTAAKMI
ncbi:hypothetical protein GCM10009097_59170 [Pigmentiphaga daeguensis]|uniref:Phosphotyrosine protein phosphatase I domain-containing protein n=1 Tax=Pigmentiphaga daeguensis TaxID=414049 RepID=A0ABP3N5P0_9BURK